MQKGRVFSLVEVRPTPFRQGIPCSFDKTHVSSVIYKNTHIPDYTFFSLLVNRYSSLRFQGRQPLFAWKRIWSIVCDRRSHKPRLVTFLNPLCFCFLNFFSSPLIVGYQMTWYCLAELKQKTHRFNEKIQKKIIGKMCHYKLVINHCRFIRRIKTKLGADIDH